MKKLLSAFTLMAALLSPLSARAQDPADVSLDFFYDNLSGQGDWIDVANYGYCFQPAVALDNPNWRPYADGYWAYTDAGWTWVSYEDFGWATYHYGRWTQLDDYGWVWVPGYEWAPAWVSWRTGGDYVGWAPLPPDVEQVYEGSAITGQVDLQYDIGPQYYNFIDVRYIGEPVLRDRIFAPARNVTIINRTVNVTNITYNKVVVYNGGPNYDRLNRYSARPIPQLSLQRENNFGGGQAATGRNFNHVNGNQLIVVAPKIRKSSQPIAPKQVKTKVAQPKVQRGWQGIENRAQLQAEMKEEDPKKISAPSFQPQKGRRPEAAAVAPAIQPNEPNNADANRPAVNAVSRPNVRAAQPAVESNQANQERPLTTREERAQQISQEQNQRAQQIEKERADRVQAAQRAQAERAQEKRDEGRPVQANQQQKAQAAEAQQGRRGVRAPEQSAAQSNPRSPEQAGRAQQTSQGEIPRPPERTGVPEQLQQNTNAPGARQVQRPPQRARANQNGEAEGKRKKPSPDQENPNP